MKKICLLAALISMASARADLYCGRVTQISLSEVPRSYAVMIAGDDGKYYTNLYCGEKSAYLDLVKSAFNSGKKICAQTLREQGEIVGVSID